MKIWTRHATYYLNVKSEKEKNIWYDMKGRPVLLIYYEDLRKNTVEELNKVFDFIKKYSNQDPYLNKLDSLTAAKCSVSPGEFKRNKPKTRPFEKQLSNGKKTLRDVVCDHVRDKCVGFWKRDDPEWDCE